MALQLQYRTMINPSAAGWMNKYFLKQKIGTNGIQSPELFYRI
jgi:hypothetical protein